MSGTTLIPLWQLPALPFVYKVLNGPHNPHPLPDYLPFVLGCCARTGRMAQQARAELREFLRLAYQDGSVVTGLLDHDGIGRDYADDFLAMFDRMAGLDQLRNRRLLEVGCGNGSLLHRFRDFGADVTGIEPGAHAEQAQSRFGVPVVRDFFPSAKVPGRFDVIVLYQVLEHVEEPEEFLRLLKAQLVDGGLLCVAVPDERPSIECGDVSVLFHEHFSYFTAASLRQTILAAGAVDVRISTSTFSHLLVAVCRFSDAGANVPDAVAAAEGLAAARHFPAQAGKIIDGAKRFFASQASAGRSTAIYVPSRIANLLTMAEIPAGGLRLFDDNRALHGTYLPGCPLVIQPRHELLEQPADDVLIASLTFGARIENSLRECGYEGRIHHLAGLAG